MDGRRALCYLLLLHVQFLMALCGLERTCTLSDFYENRRMQSRVSCSRRLPEMIKRLCKGAINIPGGSAIPQRHTRDADAADAAESIFLDKTTASKYLSKRDTSSGTQGIVCECCVHPCRRPELMQYCANRSRRSAGIAAVVQDAVHDAYVQSFYAEIGMTKRSEVSRAKRAASAVDGVAADGTKVPEERVDDRLPAAHYKLIAKSVSGTAPGREKASNRRPKTDDSSERRSPIVSSGRLLHGRMNP